MSQWWYFVTGPSSHTNLVLVVSVVKVIECDLVVIVAVHHLTGLTTGDGNENQVVIAGEYHANVLIVEPFGMSPLNCLGSITTILILAILVIIVDDKLVDLFLLKLC